MTVILAIHPASGTAIRIHTRAEADTYVAEGWRLLAMRGAPHK